MPNFWRYEKCAPLTIHSPEGNHQRELPEWFHVDVYRVTSGDTGRSYYVQILTETRVISVTSSASSQNFSTTKSTYICNCQDAMIHGLNLVAIARESVGCKHGEKLREYLEEKS
jgi:hypothetical protein